MNEPRLVDVFAMFAMLKMDWKSGEDEANADDCYAIARAMMKAREKNDYEQAGVRVDIR